MTNEKSLPVEIYEKFVKSLLSKSQSDLKFIAKECMDGLN